MDTIRIFTVDAFTDRAFAGNPAGVALLESEADAGWMQSVAAEMNLAETAFLVPGAASPGDAPEPPGGVWGLRWFTPTVEVDLCGHATLASAHVLLETGLAAADETIRFSTRSGILSAQASAEGGAIAMDFPAEPAVERPAPDGLLEALGVAEPLWVGRNRFDALVELEDSASVSKLDPDFAALAQIDVRGVIVTAPAAGEDDVDFVSRFFGPAVGVDEDPVTGSAHCALGPFWAARLGRTTLQGRQLSARGGLVGVDVRGDRVVLGGRAVTVLEGVLRSGLR